MLIIGAGVAGLSTGWRLAKAGHPVTILEAGAIGSGASHAAAGYLEPCLDGSDSLHRMEWASLDAWPGFAQEIEEETGIDIDFRTDGQVRIAYGDDTGDLLADLERRRAAGWKAELLRGAAIRELEPALSGEVTLAVHLPQVAWLDGRKLCKALAEGIRRNGGTIRENTRVTELLQRNGRVTGVRTPDGAIETDAVLLAAGWTFDAVDGLPGGLPGSKGLRGVILTLGMNPERPLIRHLVKRPDGILCPRNDGRLIAGVTRDEGRFDPLPDAGSVAAILAGSCRAVPSVAALPFIEAVCRFRPYLADGSCRYGAHGQIGGLYVSLGHGADGFLRAAAASAELSAAICAR